MAENFKRGKFSPQAKYALSLLKKNEQSINMDDITRWMSSRGYSSKTYHDLFNALVDAGLAKKTIKKVIITRVAYRKRWKSAVIIVKLSE